MTPRSQVATRMHTGAFLIVMNQVASARAAAGSKALLRHAGALVACGPRPPSPGRGTVHAASVSRFAVLLRT